MLVTKVLRTFYLGTNLYIFSYRLKRDKNISLENVNYYGHKSIASVWPPFFVHRTLIRKKTMSQQVQKNYKFYKSGNRPTVGTRP